MDVMSNACNLAAPLVSCKNKRRQVYWWSEEISDFRGSTIRARRRWFRSKRGNDPADILTKREAYITAKKSLRLAIRKAKSASWAELISTLDSDPWGLPYKLVMGKLRRSSPALSETLEENTLNRLLDSLFPLGAVDQTRPEIPTLAEEEENMNVGITDVIRFVRKRPSRDAAPGPDNLKASVWKKAPNIILAHIANLFTLCLKMGTFQTLEKGNARIDP